VLKIMLLAGFAVTAAAALADCPAPPPAQRNIIADSYYDDPPVYSHIDPVRHAAYEAAVAPLETFLRAVAKSASDGDKECTLRWLVGWAEGDAMLGTIKKEQAHYERKWLLAGLALSYAKVRDAATSDQRAAIDTWLLALADGVRKHSDAYKGTKNNHYYWEGLAVGATGAVTGNAADLAWSRKVFRAAEADISDDGILPLEMKRGSRALHYHLFSVAPLVMLESILDEHSAKLEKLVVICAAAGKDQDWMAKRAGAPQVELAKGEYDWLPVYFRHNPPQTEAWNQFKIPLGYVNVSRLGGDLKVANPLEHVKKLTQ
jgi:poly(beta-D-mannuronate) lyase